MRGDYRILDADRHVIEPMEMWAQYLPTELRQYAPYLVPAERVGSDEERVRLYGPKGLFPLAPVPMFQGQPLWNKLSDRARVELSWSGYERHRELGAAMTGTGQLETMDQSQIDIATLYPTFAAYLLGIDSLDPKLGTAFARAYNDWLRDYCSHDPKRLRGVGLMSAHEPAAMVDEVERIASFGWTAVIVRPNPVKGRLLSNPAYEPFWTTCEHLSIGVGIHEGAHTYLPTTGADRFDSHFAMHACSHPMEQMMALLALIEGGVLERHPNLRVALLESGCGWLPYWLHRLDTIEYANVSLEVADHVKRKPSEYFKRQCYIAIEPNEPYLPALIDIIGADNLLFGTDFPHLDHTNDIVGQALGLSSVLSEDVVRKILWNNPARFYGLNDQAKPSISGETRAP